MKISVISGSRGVFTLVQSILSLFLVITLVSSVTACFHNDDDKEERIEETGQVVIGLTDAEGDFLRYKVDVVSLKLTKANGAVVETVPVNTSVDFAQYTDMTEFLTAATVPTGFYVNATLTLDYSNADIQVEDSAGSTVTVDNIRDESGNVVNRTTMDVRLQGRNALFISPGIPAHLTLDFDLNATNSIEFNNGNATLTVAPFILAEVNVESPKIHRARGALRSVNTQGSSFRIIIRPFIHLISGGNEQFGTLNIVTDGNTVFDISGSIEQGSAGLTLLNQQITLTAIVVIGDLKLNPIRFVATEVRSGSSVAGGTLDVVSGNVISRSGNVLNVKGATLIRTDGSVIFNDQVQVTLSNATLVRRQLSIDPLSIDAVSVGQRVSIFGSLTDSQAQNLTLDASDGYVHLLMTSLRADVVSTSPFSANLQAIDGRRLALFDFTGTGAVQDADPSNYMIDTGNIDISNIAIGDVIKVRGFVKPFANNEVEDFTANTIVNVSKVAGNLLVGWPQGSTTALDIDSTAQTVTLNLDGVGIFHHISRAGVVTDLQQLGMNTVLQSNNVELGLYFVLENGVWQLHTSYSTYLNELQSRLANGRAVRSVIASGTFDDNSAIMKAGMMIVHLI